MSSENESNMDAALVALTGGLESTAGPMPIPIETMVYLLKVRWFARTLFVAYLFLSICALVLILTIVGVYAANFIPTMVTGSPMFMWLVFLVVVVTVAFPISVLFYFVDSICSYLIRREENLYAKKLMQFQLIEH